jgi:hypothetical protein
MMVKEDFKQPGELTSSFWKRCSLVDAGWMMGGRCEDKESRISFELCKQRPKRKTCHLEHWLHEAPTFESERRHLNRERKILTHWN